MDRYKLCIKFKKTVLHEYYITDHSDKLDRDNFYNKNIVKWDVEQDFKSLKLLKNIIKDLIDDTVNFWYVFDRVHNKYLSNDFTTSKHILSNSINYEN